MTQALFALLAFLCFAPPAAAAEITVAAASDLSFAMKELAPAFERESGHRVRVTLGSSGNLATQIENGAPFDMLMSADSDYPKRLVASGHGIEPVVVYGHGRVVLWVPNSSELDLQRDGLRSLLSPVVRKIAIANPQHAPYGRAAEKALRDAGLYEQVRGKLVIGENVSQAGQFVESGNAQAGLIAHSLAVAPAMREKGRWVEIPGAVLPQAAVVTRRGAANAGARAFVDFLRSKPASDILTRYGFQQVAP